MPDGGRYQSSLAGSVWNRWMQPRIRKNPSEVTSRQLKGRLTITTRTPFPASTLLFLLPARFLHLPVSFRGSGFKVVPSIRYIVQHGGRQMLVESPALKTKGRERRDRLPGGVSRGAGCVSATQPESQLPAARRRCPAMPSKRLNTSPSSALRCLFRPALSRGRRGPIRGSDTGKRPSAGML